MKLFNAFVLAVCLVAPSVFAWHLRALLPSIFLPAPRIPQFILDTHHPWLDKHKSDLARLEDPKHALCALDSPLRPSNNSEADDSGLQYSPDLFRYLEVNNNRAGVSRPGWKNAVARLKEMRECPAALADVEEFIVNIWISDGSFGIGYPEPSTPPAELPNLFVDVLSSMPKLQKLKWNTFGNGNEVFRSAFEEANLTLSSVRHLVPAMYTEWLVTMCPATQVLESGESESTAKYWRGPLSRPDGRELFVNSTQLAQNLSDFRMTGVWRLMHLESLLDVSPSITNLTIGGELSVERGYMRQYGHILDDQLDLEHDPFGDGDPSMVDEPDRVYVPDPNAEGRTLKAFINILARFPSLEHLRLPPAQGLDLGFDGGPWCGNAYMGPNGEALSQRVSRQSEHTTELAGRIVLKRLPGLKSLEIGSSRANFSLDNSGDMNVEWPWTDQKEAQAEVSWAG